MYLHQQGYVSDEISNPEYAKIIHETRKSPVEEKVKALRGYWEKKLGRALSEVPEYQPYGTMAAGINNADFVGGRVEFHRFDMSEDRVKKFGDRYSVFHSLTFMSGETTMEDPLRKILEGTGSLVSTQEKLRIGVPFGDSAKVDLQVGGGSYVFTSLVKKPTRDSVAMTGIYFKPELISRMDAIVTPMDEHGNIYSYQRIKGRRVEPEVAAESVGEWDWTRNETMFKDSIGLLENVDFIMCKDIKERDAVIKIIQDTAKEGWLEDNDHLFDGRPLTEVVRYQKGAK
jgi:hypothetical protein